MLAVGIDLVDRAARPQNASHKAVAVGHARQQMIFAPKLRHSGTGERIHDFRLVAAHDIKRLAVWSEKNGVGAVLAAGSDFTQQLRLVEVIAAISGANAI